MADDRIDGTLLRLSAFTTDPAGGNPAGVWLGASLPDDARMLAIAAEVGYSETAFLAPHDSGAAGHYRIRYFSPLAEVPFCGHATIASGVAIAERADGATHALVFETNNGPVPVDVADGPDGRPRATLTSVEPRVVDAPADLVDDVLGYLDWSPAELDQALPPAVAYAGAFHLVLAVGTLATLQRMTYPFEALQARMLEADLTTIQLVWREASDRFRARDPFPVGGVVEDPATGAAAAALGAYLRWRGELQPPAGFHIVQGVEMGRPSLLEVEIPDASGGIRVSGTAVAIGSAPT